MSKYLDEIQIAVNGCGSGDEEKGFHCGETHLCKGCLDDVNKMLEIYPDTTAHNTRLFNEGVEAVCTLLQSKYAGCVNEDDLRSKLKRTGG